MFQPSFKFAEKTREGARVRKRYHAPETPCARLLAADAIPAVMKDRLRTVLGTVGPLGRLPVGHAISAASEEAGAHSITHMQ